MINKKNLWFLTLFSLVLVLSIYYVTMPNQLLEKAEEVIEEKNEETVEFVIEESALTAMRVNLEEASIVIDTVPLDLAALIFPVKLEELLKVKLKLE